MTDATEIQALREEVKALQVQVTRLERVIDGMADLLRPKTSDGSQGRITRWMN
jgi:hypothetical protein